MRPKRRILLVSHREDAQAVRRFLLETRGYRVFCASTVREALDLTVREDVDLAVVDLEFEEGDGVAMGSRLAGMLKLLDGEIRTMLIGEEARAGSVAHAADCLLGKGSCSPADLVERCKVMTARRRGPKPVRRVEAEGMAEAHG